MNLMLVHTHAYIYIYMTCAQARGIYISGIYVSVFSFPFFIVQIFNVLVLKKQITLRVVTDHQQKKFQVV